MPNLQRVKALIDGEVRYIRVTTRALKSRALVTKAPKRTWKKDAVKGEEGVNPEYFQKRAIRPRFFSGKFVLDR